MKLAEFVGAVRYVVRHGPDMLADRCDQLVKDIHSPDPATIPDRDPYSDWLTEAQPGVRCRLDHKPWPCKEWLRADDALISREGVR